MCLVHPLPPRPPNPSASAAGNVARAAGSSTKGQVIGQRAVVSITTALVLLLGLASFAFPELRLLGITLVALTIAARLYFDSQRKRSLLQMLRDYIS